ncbi:hypothetical protein EG68_04379 [Paragonimus skrjabini miyazakii]|uniref:Tetraspanin n=1 Tax=Paragonimus skrjabini miyazakii TaxID=59628 RepID=A0A8S9Z3I3_9TREM|nr:hypothetical protein EG68_04379 [Paragonimus skrjabini miyazakii]
MELTWLKRRLFILRTLHVCFIVTLLFAGLVGLVLFGYIVHQPMRTCPVIYAVYTTFWLCLGLAILQVALSLVFLLWFLVSMCSSSKLIEQPGSVTLANAPTDCHASRTILEAIGNPCTNSMRITRPSTDTGSVLSIRGRTNTSIRSCQRCRPGIGWLCLGGVFLTFLSAGLILGMVLVVMHGNYLHTRFPVDLRSVFIEAVRDFQTSMPNKSSQHNKALVCWDKLQLDFHCCGYTGYIDWFQPNISGSVPSSCICRVCNNRPVASVMSDLVYAVGCEEHVKTSLGTKLSATQFYLAIALGLIIVTFFADLVYTLFTAYVTLARSREDSYAPHLSSAMDLYPIQGGRNPKPDASCNHCQSSTTERQTRYQM